MKNFTLLFLILWVQVVWSQDTIIGWTFPGPHNESFLANLGIEENIGTPLYFYDEAGGTYGGMQIYSDPEGSIDDYIAGGYDWSNGNQTKCWLMSFKAPGHGGFRIYSKQRSNTTDPGPMNFKVQYTLDPVEGPAWVDIQGGEVVCTSVWSTGILNGVELPDEVNFPENMVSIRWLMNGELDINGNIVSPTSISLIDQIVVTAYTNPGTREDYTDATWIISPCQADRSVKVSSLTEIDDISVFTSMGKCIYKDDDNFYSGEINLSGNTGTFIVRFTTIRGETIVRKLILF